MILGKRPLVFYIFHAQKKKLRIFLYSEFLAVTHVFIDR